MEKEISRNHQFSVGPHTNVLNVTSLTLEHHDDVVTFIRHCNDVTEAENCLRQKEELFARTVNDVVRRSIFRWVCWNEALTLIRDYL